MNEMNQNLMDDLQSIQDMQNNHNFDDSDYSMDAFLNLHKKDFSRLEQLDDYNNKKPENLVPHKMDDNPQITSNEIKKTLKVDEIKKTSNPYEQIKQPKYEKINLFEKVATKDSLKNQETVKRQQSKKKEDNILIQDNSFQASEISYQQQKPKVDKHNLSYNQCEISYQQQSIQQQSQLKNRKTNHIPQMIDEDTEQFKIKLENLVNIFKADAVSEFMSMKKGLLENQEEQIKQDTAQYMQMFKQKENECEQTIDLLNTKSKLCDSLQTRCEVLALLYGQCKIKLANQKLIQKYFYFIKTFKKYQKEKQRKNEQALKLKKMHQYKIIFDLLRKNKEEQKLSNMKQKLDIEQQEQIDEITNKYNKELHDTKQKLQDALKSYQQSEIQKTDMQEKLKQAFMRGVCALNFEAMNVIQGGEDIQQQAIKENVLPQTKNISEKLNDLGNNLFESIESQQQMKKSKIVYYQNPKVESKDHRWQDAPVVGFNPPMTQSVKIEMDCKNDFNDKQNNQQNEGKVIKAQPLNSYTYEDEDEMLNNKESRVKFNNQPQINLFKSAPNIIPAKQEAKKTQIDPKTQSRVNHSSLKK